MLPLHSCPWWIKPYMNFVQCIHHVGLVKVTTWKLCFLTTWLSFWENSFLLKLLSCLLEDIHPASSLLPSEEEWEEKEEGTITERWLTTVGSTSIWICFTRRKDNITERKTKSIDKALSYVLSHPLHNEWSLGPSHEHSFVYLSILWYFWVLICIPASFF